MSSRFGCVSPARALVLKLRWLIGAMVATIFVLTTALVYVSLPEPGAAMIEPLDVEDTPAATVNLLVPRERIELGAPLAAGLFRTVPARSTPELATFVTLDGEVRIDGKFARRVLEPGFTFTAADITAELPLSELQIPPGFRAITLALEQRDISGGFVRSHSRVDVLWRYTDRSNTKKIATLVHAVKVLSVTPPIDPSRASPLKSPIYVTLLVSARDAKGVELARTEGGISLALLGGEELLPAREDPDVLALPRILKGTVEVEPEPEPVVDGTMRMNDPETGKLRSFELVNGQWRPARSAQ